MITATASTVREEISAIIKDIPEYKLQAMKPLLTVLKEEDDYWQPVIETDLTEEEHAILDECRDEYLKRPEPFASLEAIREDIGI